MHLIPLASGSCGSLKAGHQTLRGFFAAALGVHALACSRGIKCIAQKKFSEILHGTICARKFTGGKALYLDGSPVHLDAAGNVIVARGSAVVNLA